VKPLVYALPGNEAFADGLCAAWPAERGALEQRQFPDGETLVRLGTSPHACDVVLACTLHEPDAKLVPLLFAAAAAREQGAASVGLVAPYLAYMRQDRSFHPGEARSAAHFAQILSSHFDWLVTVDPHLHRVHSLDEVFRIPGSVVPAAPLLAGWIAANVQRPLLIGPDEESRQWVERIAEIARAPWLVLRKERLGDRRVALKVPDVARFSDHTPVLADDIISSGGTLIEVVRQLREQGLKAPVCVAVHAVFAPWSYWGLLEAGAKRVVTANTIAHVSNAIDVSATVADAGRALLASLTQVNAAQAHPEPNGTPSHTVPEVP
jgi:ribose-phosphate pyrophosphokinase